MGYRKVLQSALIPALILLVLSLLSLLLTTHYWIATDFIVGRWIPVSSQFKEHGKFPVDDVVIFWTEPSTNATVTSGSLNLAAAVMATVSLMELRKRKLDTDFNAPLRRFWVVAVFLMCTSGIAAALAAIILHYVDKGPDQYGCTPEIGKTVSEGKPFTNLYCSRELGTCNFAKPKLKGKPNEWVVKLVCNETIIVKWLQVVLIVIALIVMAMFGVQARMRSRARVYRLGKQLIPDSR